jgi:putative sigma-54 modulation protein
MTIKVNVFSRNIQISDDLNDQILKKVGNLDRYLDDIKEARVDVSVTNARSADEREVVQITVQGKGFLLRAEERSADVVSSLNNAVDTLQRRIKRYKGKRNQRWKQGLEADDILPEEEEFEDDFPQIARRKRFSLRPMDEWEAIEQMELSGHDDFFVFYNAKSESINILYKRYDGTLGLIEPVVG